MEFFHSISMMFFFPLLVDAIYLSFFALFVVSTMFQLFCYKVHRLFCVLAILLSVWSHKRKWQLLNLIKLIPRAEARQRQFRNISNGRAMEMERQRQRQTEFRCLRIHAGDISSHAHIKTQKIFISLGFRFFFLQWNEKCFSVFIGWTFFSRTLFFSLNFCCPSVLNLFFMLLSFHQNLHESCLILA